MQQQALGQITDVNSLDAWLAERHLNGHWRGMESRPPFRPFVWRWNDIYQGLMKAAEVVPMSDTPRRTVQLRNPSLGDRMSETIHMSVQCVMPGEFAKAHHHTAAAIRFVIQGAPGADTVVEGEPFPMRPGDLITTPNWTWHDHYNRSDQPVIWLDGLDSRLVSLGKVLQEDFPQDQQPIERPVGYSAHALARARPAWLARDHPTPPFRYPWEEAFRGQGEAEVDGELLEWSQGDIFVIPPWSWHKHGNRAGQDAILFSMSDWPTLSALGLYREEGGRE